MSEEEKKELIMDDIKEVFDRKEEASDMPGILDVITQKFFSRKLIVFIIATIFLFLGKVDSEQWMMISAIYIGSVSIIEIVANWKRGGGTEGAA